MEKIALFTIYLYTLISRLPLRWHYFIAHIFGGFMTHIRIFPIQKTIRQRIEQAFPNENKEWKRETEKRFYQKASDFAAEFIKFITWRDDEIASRMHFKNIQLLKDLLEQHQCVVCYAGHFVNYELFTALPMHLENYAMCNFYDDAVRSLYPSLDRWLQNLRSRCGCINIPISSPLRELLRLNDEIKSGKSRMKGFVIGSLLDTRKAWPNSPTTLIMGEEFPLHYGTEKIGRRLGAAFVFAHISCPERGQYEVTLKQLHPDPEGSYMSAYIEALECNIRQQPALWLMWGAS